ncbi:putative uncharacterized protein DDB_G0282133 [Toxorhynchites rutilus septentrionalis]|uniref:putative uncharacterized protein DDB_G0282133 n=1 Tax=Toxorhynchites rutilus septentrionalis TaxID=329112 RepID=UPI00247AD84D|nr:putative uncharacterized protein DDB_G0282133 [Toxorhynchites rutilus septentrionalis]
MDFKVSYERFIQNVKYQLIRIEKNIEKEVSEWEIKLAPSDRVSVKANVLDSKGTTFKDHECKLESKIVEFEQRVVKLEKEKDRMKLDILNLKQEKSVLSNKLNHFQELKLFEHRLNKILERKIRNKTDLKAQVSNNLQEIGRLEKQLKNEKNFHSAIEKEKKSLERKIEELQRQTTESNKANPQNLKPLKAKKMMKKKKANQENIYKCKSRLKESKTKLKYADRENSQLAEKNFLLVVEDALKQEKKKTQEVITLLEKWKEKFHELEEKIQTTVQNQAAYEFPMKEIDEEEELREIHNRLQSTRMRTSQQQQNNYNRSTQANNYNYNRNNKNNRRGNNNDYREQRNNYRGNNNNYRGNKSNYRRNNINFGKNYNNYQGTRNFDNNNGYNNNNNSNPNENYRENNRNGGYYKNNNNNYRRHKDNQNS